MKRRTIIATALCASCALTLLLLLSKSAGIIDWLESEMFQINCVVLNDSNKKSIRQLAPGDYLKSAFSWMVHREIQKEERRQIQGQLLSLNSCDFDQHEKIVSLRRQRDDRYFANPGHRLSADLEAKIALSTANDEVRNHPKDPQAYCHRAEANHVSQHDAQAQSDYGTSCSLDPRQADTYSSRAFFYLARLHILMSDNATAVKDASKAIKLNSDFDDTGHFLRAKAAFNLGDYKQAKTDYSALIQSDPDDAQSYYERGVVEEKLNNYVAARADKKKAVALGYKSEDLKDPLEHMHWNDG